LTCFGHLGNQKTELKNQLLKKYYRFSKTLKTRSASNWKRFRFYSLYAWLGSLMMTISILLATLELDKSHPLFLDIGKDKCSVDENGIQYWGTK
jgi:hypothetical protein